MHVVTLADKTTISEVRRRIRAELNEITAPAALAFDCLVAVSEACTNALVHGRGDDRTPPPEIGWEIGPGYARFEVRDFSNVEGSDRPSEDGTDPRVGGYGLKMMRRLMDAVDIRFSPGGTTVSMHKTFAEAEARPAPSSFDE